MTPEKAKEMNEEHALERGNDLAFPIDESLPSHKGLTKREWMATQLMAGFLTQGYTSDVAADRSIRAVDNLLIALHTNQK